MVLKRVFTLVESDMKSLDINKTSCSLSLSVNEPLHLTFYEELLSLDNRLFKQYLL